jgi:hypothetical protein
VASRRGVGPWCFADAWSHARPVASPAAPGARHAAGKGRFLLDYGGELLTGEATRVSGEDRKGVASAHGAGGSYMSCEYQMNTPLQGAGTCTFSNGARYRVHIGN